MRRKGFLKNIIGALCVGVLISMPVTVSAAEKEDVVGEWVGGGQTFIFYENDMAEHHIGDFQNTRLYHMESGSLTITYRSTGATETVDYNLWRGEEMGDTARDNVNAVIFQETEPGRTMKSWNVVKSNGQWIAFDPLFISKKADEGSNTSSTSSSSTDSVSPSRGCDHLYEWTITTEPTETADGESSYVCTFCGDIKARQPVSADVVIREKLLASIKNAGAGTTVTFDNKSWLCYPQYVLDALKEKGDVSLKTDFTYGGTNYSFTIPAGSDYTNLEQADFYGFMYLYGAYNGTIVE